MTGSSAVMLDISLSAILPFLLRPLYFDFCGIWTSDWSRSIGRSTVLVEVKFGKKKSKYYLKGLGPSKFGVSKYKKGPADAYPIFLAASGFCYSIGFCFYFSFFHRI